MEVRREACTHRQGGGVGVEDVDPELLQCFLEDDVHHGVVLAVLRLQVCDLHARQRHTNSKTSDQFGFFYPVEQKSENVKIHD